MQQAQQPTGPQAPGGVDPQGPVAPQQPAADQPGWNAQVEQAFRGLGMPDEVIQLYAQSGAPASGLEAAYRHAASRVEDFTQRGWMQKFNDAGVPPLETWSAILGDEPASDEDLEKMLVAHAKGQQSLWQKGGQLATSLFPGGRLLQYAFGTKFVTGEKIDRTAPMEIGMAALSGLALFAAIRGGKNVMGAINARNGGYAALNGVSDTLSGLGLPRGGVDAMEQAAMGATQTWGAKQKILSFVPGTSLHREVVGLGHAEAAARAFNGGGAARILANDADGALQLATLTQVFDDIKSGAMRIQGGSNAYLAQLKNGPIMTLGSAKGGGDLIKVAKGMGMGNGNSQLVGLMEVGGTKLGRTPEWLASATNLVDDVQNLAQVQRDTLGRVMAGNLAGEIGGFTRDGRKALRYVDSLRSSSQPVWYQKLADATKSQWPSNQMPSELFDALSNHRFFTGMFDEAATALRGIDRSTLSPQVSGMLDDAVARMGEARGSFEAAKVAGRLGDDVVPKVAEWDQAVARLFEADDAVARAVFGSYIDEGSVRMAQVAARDAVRADWAAQAATKLDDVAEAAVDAVRGMPQAGADDAVAAARAVAGDVDLQALRAANQARPVNPPVQLSANAAGEAVTPAGLVVPSYASPVGAQLPRSVDDPAVARLAAAMQQIRG
jgi:hypothetical protein